MKATQTQIIEFLQKLGVVDVEIVENEDDSEFNASEALTSVDGSRTPIIQQKIEEGLRDSITPEIKGEIYGRVNATLSKEFGVSRSLLEKAENVNDVAALIKQEYTSNFEGDKSEMEKKYNELLSTKSQEVEAKETEWKDRYAQLEDSYYTREMIDYVLAKLKDAPVTWDRQIAAKEILADAKNKYDVKIEDGELKLYDKGKNTLALNDAKNEPINITDYSRGYLQDRNGWAKDMRGAKPQEIVRGQSKKEVDPYIDRGQGDKISNSWEAIKAAREAAQTES